MRAADGTELTADVVDEVLAGHPIVRTGDLGAAAAALERVLPRVPVRLRVSEAGAPVALRMNAVTVGAVTASYVYSNASLHVVHHKLANYHVNIPLQGSTLWREGSLSVHSAPGIAVVHSPGVAGEALWGAGCGQVCVLLPPYILERELGRYLEKPIEKPLRFDPEMALNSASARAWLDALRLVCRTADECDDPQLHPLAAQAFENLLVDGLLLAQPHNYTTALHTPVQSGSPRAVRAAIELLRADPAHPWTVGELAQQVHLSVRALQQAFVPAVGMPPMRYLRHLRLGQVHNQLRQAHATDTTVTETAARWGFTHHGHFAAAYRSEFGESPSQTLHH